MYLTLRGSRHSAEHTARKEAQLLQALVSFDLQIILLARLVISVPLLSSTAQEALIPQPALLVDARASGLYFHTSLDFGFSTKKWALCAQHVRINLRAACERARSEQGETVPCWHGLDQIMHGNAMNRHQTRFDVIHNLISFSTAQRLKSNGVPVCVQRAQRLTDSLSRRWC